MTVGTFSHNTIWGEVISENHSYFHAEPVFLNIYSIYFIFSLPKDLKYFVKIQLHENKNAASEYILTQCANPVLMVFAQNHQMIENSQTSMSNTECPTKVVQQKLSNQSCPFKVVQIKTTIFGISESDDIFNKIKIENQHFF